MSRKLVMGYTAHDERRHLVDGDDLAVALCGVKVTTHVRRGMSNDPDAPLVLYADHWRDDAITGSDRICDDCRRLEQVSVVTSRRNGTLSDRTPPES